MKCYLYHECYIICMNCRLKSKNLARKSPSQKNKMVHLSYLFFRVQFVCVWSFSSGNDNFLVLTDTLLIPGGTPGVYFFPVYCNTTYIAPSHFFLLISSSLMLVSCFISPTKFPPIRFCYRNTHRSAKNHQQTNKQHQQNKKPTNKTTVTKTKAFFKF